MNIGYKSILVAGMLALGMTGCLFDSDDDAAVTITIDSETAKTTTAGQNIAVKGTVEGEGALTLVYTVTSSDSNVIDSLVTATGDAPGTDSKVDLEKLNVKILVPANACNGDYNLNIKGTSGTASSDKDFAFKVTGGTDCSKTVPVGTNLSAEVSFTFERVGGTAGTGLEMYGLAWTSNTATVAVIKKDADKLVVLAASDWTSITTKEALKAKVDAGTDVADYRGVSSAQSGSYDDVIATKKGTEYYLINIKSGEVSSVAAGTKIVISGKSKN